MELFEKLPPSLDYKDKFQIIIPCRVAPAFLGRFPNKLEGFVSIRGSSLFSGGKSNNHRYNLCNFQVIMKLTHWALSTFLVLLTLWMLIFCGENIFMLYWHIGHCRHFSLGFQHFFLFTVSAIILLLQQFLTPYEKESRVLPSCRDVR